MFLNASNTFTGGVTINGGIVRLGNIGALNTASPNNVTFGASAPVGSKLQLNGFSVVVAGLNSNATPGTPVVENASPTAATLTINNTGTNTFAGVIQDGAGGGILSLTKTGAGNQVLGGVNTYTGATTISGGILTVNGSLAAASAVSVGGLGTISGFGTVNGLTTVQNPAASSRPSPTAPNRSPSRVGSRSSTRARSTSPTWRAAPLLQS